MTLSKPDQRALLDRFFQLLNERKIAACGALLDEARTAGQYESPLLYYLQAILYV